MNQILDHYQKLYQQEVIDDDCEDISHVSVLKTYENFKLPIEYTKTKELTSQVKSDIEFNDNENNLFTNLLSKENPSLLLNKWSTLYTTDKKFLKDNQKLLKKYTPLENNMHVFMNQYVDFKAEQNFLSKYQYVQFRRFFYLNTIIGFLQLLALYNICSPLMSLCAPLLGLIVPYFILYFKGIRLSFQDYMIMVKKIILNNFIIRNLLDFKKTTLQQKLYALVYLFFYGMGFYHNVVSCIQFFRNTQYMIELNDNYSSFLEEGNKLISHIHSKTKPLKQFSKFNQTMMEHQKNIHDMTVSIISLKKAQSKLIKCGQIGLLMKCHFDLYYNQQYHDTIMYLCFLNQYHKDMNHLSLHLKNETLRPCEFTKKNTKIKGMYYLNHLKEKKVTNNIHFDKNIVITGPNASGKTTIIKSCIINLFLSQSIGIGCFDSCKTKLYDYFHSYLNIPDTSNRDSLFQAEARRCKNIYEEIKKNKKSKHLCIFDEIYSGTNPSDAVLCASVYLNGMNSHKSHVDYVLTTHYLELCDKFKEHEIVKNQQMNVIQRDKDEIVYTYTLKNGISDVHGGYQILQKMDYPEELLNK